MKKTMIIASLLIILVICIVTSPQTALKAAEVGFNIWWNYLFPVLLPMYLLLTLCKALGLFHSISHLLLKFRKQSYITPNQLAPFVYRWFTGSTFVSYLAADKEQQLEHTFTKRQLTLLLTLTYSANPIFIIVVIFTAFIKIPSLGIYLSSVLALATFICASLIHFNIKTNVNQRQVTKSTSMLAELENGRHEDGRSIGKLLGEGIYESVQQLFFIGGVMLFGSVIAAYLQPLFAFQSVFQFSFVIEQHLAAYALLQSKLSFQIVIMLIAILLSTGGLIQLFLITDQFKQKALSVTSFLLMRLLHVFVTVVIFLLSFPWLSQRFNWSSALQTFSEPDLLSTATISSKILFTNSLFMTSLLLLVVIFLTFVADRALQQYYKNKQA